MCVCVCARARVRRCVLVEMAKKGTQQLWLGVDSEGVFDATEDAWQVV